MQSEAACFCQQNSRADPTYQLFWGLCQRNAIGLFGGLAGYGYAAVGESTRSHWNDILSNYLQNRKSLVGLVLIVDARRGLTELDEQMIRWFGVTQKPIHILLSKSDKQTYSENRDLLHSINEQVKQFAPAQISAQLFSSTKRVGLEESDTLIQEWLFKESFLSENTPN